MLLREIQHQHFPTLLKLSASQTLDEKLPAFVREKTLMVSFKSLKFLETKPRVRTLSLVHTGIRVWGDKGFVLPFTALFAWDEYRQIFFKGTNLTPKNGSLNLFQYFTGASHLGMFHHLQLTIFLLECNPVCHYLVLFHYCCFTWLAWTYPTQMK